MMGSPALFPFHSQAQSNNIYLPLKSSLAEGEKESKTRCCTKSKKLAIMLAPSPPHPSPYCIHGTWKSLLTAIQACYIYDCELPLAFPSNILNARKLSSKLEH